MQAVVPEINTLGKSIDASADCFVHVWPVSVTKDGERKTIFEIEIHGSHDSDPSHLDPSCPLCEHLRARLHSIAIGVVENVSAEAAESVVFDVYSDPGRLVIPQQNGHQPSVVVSISVHTIATFAETPQTADAISAIKAALSICGIREL